MKEFIITILAIISACIEQLIDIMILYPVLANILLIISMIILIYGLLIWIPKQLDKL